MDNTEMEILLVEDNLNDAALTMGALLKNKIGNKLVHLKDGSEALDFLFGTGKFAGRNLNNKPNVILPVLKMPKVNGIEVLTKIKSNELTNKIPVVMLTFSKEHPDIDRANELGVNSYVVKPVNLIYL